MLIWTIICVTLISAKCVLSIRQDAKFKEDVQHVSEFIDVDSDMSRLLREANVISDDVINKPIDKYHLQIDSGSYKHNPWISGVFQGAGTYGGLLAGGSVGGLPGMLAGGPIGWEAGNRAAETLTRILQGASVALSQEYAVRHDRQGTSAVTSAVLRPDDGAPAGQEVLKKKEEDLLLSIRDVLKLGKRDDVTADAVLAGTLGPVLAPQGFTASMLHTEIKQKADRQVLRGLGSMLKSDDDDTSDDAKLTVTLLDIMRHRDENVEVTVK
eukprot:TRINITY_DN63209_c0_g1_i1.p1 TRINITY_DN63209_c0_g1~~TRINITY_DN63209_c0_g1_i1.p1  ORF type:complete len:269 (-),score=42.13 TRINITY_DN63209_c0_g1_i1:112-918(-)